MIILSNFLKIVQRQGLTDACGWLAERGRTRYYEWRLGIHSDQVVSLDEMGVSNEEFRPYVPSDYRSFVRVLNSIVIRPNQDVFIDFGSGMARAVILAATKPFNRVIGVEMSEKLNSVARENLRRAEPRLKCANVELITCDATLFEIPPDATFLYFNNPFSGQVLNKVLANIKQSLQSCSRQMTLICRLPERSAFEETILHQTWIRQTKEMVFDVNIKYKLFICGGSPA
jgi:hypothetical protein